MDRMLYVAMTGAKQTMIAQTINAHNMANVSTTGFRADLNAFLSVPVIGEGFPSRVNVVTRTPSADFTPGKIMSTGRELDMAINGNGWFAIQAKDGSEAYTRAGDLRIAVSGLLTNGAGYPVIGSGGPIVIPPAEKVEIGVDGTITIRPIGQTPNALVALDQIKMVNPGSAALVKSVDGLMRMRGGVPAVADINTSLITGALETSNVNPVDALVKQITLARQFEIQVKAMKAADENASITTQMMRLN